MTHHDLVIVGTGSGNTIPGPGFEDWSIGIVEAGLFGGTCLNVGCIPTKSFVYPADVIAQAVRAEALGVRFGAPVVDWVAIRDRIFARLDAIEAAGRAYREGPENPNVSVYAGRGRFVGPKTMTVTYPAGGDSDSMEPDTITADRWVLAAGGHAVVPPVPGLRLGPRVHTSDTIMRIEELPESLLILGGGYIACEFAHVFSAFGTEVTQVTHGDRLLRRHDRDVRAAVATAAAARRELHFDIEIDEVTADDSGVDLRGRTGDGLPWSARAAYLLVAVGRAANSAELNVAATGVDVTPDGRVAVDEYQRTTVPGIWALGDLSSRYALKHVANHEARVVAHNLAHPDDPIASDHRYVPSAVFTDPQVACCGATEDDLIEAGTPYAVGRRDYGGTAYGWAREDTEGFVKVLADPVTGLLLGAHVVGPEAATVIQPLVQAMSFGQRAHDVARGQYWIHPAMAEVVENALLALPEPTDGSTPTTGAAAQSGEAAAAGT